MAGTGRPPKPTRMKVAAGNPGHRPLNPDEPRPDVAEPPVPAWLPKAAKAEWKRIAPELLALGVLAEIDLAALAAYCTAFAELEAATRTLEKDGRVCVWPIVDKAGDKIGERLRPHPCVAMQRSAAGMVKAFLVEFGLTPASRTRVHAGKGAGAKGDDRETRFFNTVG